MPAAATEVRCSTAQGGQLAGRLTRRRRRASPRARPTCEDSATTSCCISSDMSELLITACRWAKRGDAGSCERRRRAASERRQSDSACRPAPPAHACLGRWRRHRAAPHALRAAAGSTPRASLGVRSSQAAMRGCGRAAGGDLGLVGGQELKQSQRRGGEAFERRRCPRYPACRAASAPHARQAGG